MLSFCSNFQEYNTSVPPLLTLIRLPPRFKLSLRLWIHDTPVCARARDAHTQTKVGYDMFIRTRLVRESTVRLLVYGTTGAHRRVHAATVVVVDARPRTTQKLALARTNGGAEFTPQSLAVRVFAWWFESRGRGLGEVNVVPLLRTAIATRFGAGPIPYAVLGAPLAPQLLPPHADCQSPPFRLAVASETRARDGGLVSSQPPPEAAVLSLCTSWDSLGLRCRPIRDRSSLAVRGPYAYGVRSETWSAPQDLSPCQIRDPAVRIPPPNQIELWMRSATEHGWRTVGRPP